MPHKPVSINRDPTEDIYQVLSHFKKVQTEIEASSTHPPLKKLVTQ
jgi:hypothetical protein